MNGAQIRRSAVVSACGKWRYALSRQWTRDDGKSSFLRCTFVMLNPSTADADIDDPTIRRCMGFAGREGFDHMTVVNLFAFRCTNPKWLPLENELRVGPENESYVCRAVELASLVVVAWGANPSARVAGERIRTIRNDLMCLGTTNLGAPRHPLYVRADQPLVRWEGSL